MTVPPIDYAAPLTWLSLAMLVLLLLLIGYVAKQPGLTSTRKTVRLALHGLLWLALLGLWLQPRWRTQLPAGRVLLVANNVPRAVLTFVQDSLRARDVVRASDFQGATDTVVLLGQAFSDRTLAQLARQVVTWVPYDAPNQLAALSWQGVVRRGERQMVTGQLATPDGGLLRLRFGQHTLDSVRVKGPKQPFILQYPVFSQGQTTLTLWLNEGPLDTLRFVARPLNRLRVRFVLDAPDFETRALADWLGQQGHRVELTSSLSKGIGSSLAINGPTSPNLAGQAAPNPLPDLVITDPANSGNALISRAITAGKSVLVLNLSRPDSDVPAINRALGTRGQVRRVPGKDSLRVGPALTALPFRFELGPGTIALPIGTYPSPTQPVVMQPGRNGSRVAISLITETFPLRLSGDSTAYERLWLSVLAPLQPTAANTVSFEAPLFQQQPTRLTLNNPTAKPASLRFGPDTVALRPLPINARADAGLLRPTQPGWQPLADTLAGYVYSSTANGALASLAQRKKIAAMVRIHRRYDRFRPSTTRFIETALPDWAWFACILLLLSGVWLEPKVG